MAANLPLQPTQRPFRTDETNFLKWEEYFQILRDAEKITDFIDRPPFRPKGGHLYLYVNEERVEDWKADQYRWRDCGRSDIPKNNPCIVCHYFKEYNEAGFFKRAIILYQPGKKYDKTTLIHYVGNANEVVPKPHGNRKLNLHIPHKMTAKSTRNTIKENLTAPPQETYKKLIQRNCHPTVMPVVQPRDRKQVNNLVTLEREKKSLSKDDIHGLYLFGDQHCDMVKSYVMLPNFYCIIYSSESFELFQESKQLPKFALFYDTTFNIGDFFLSILTYKNLIFTEEPVIPLAFLVHHRKTLEVHREFFHHTKRYIDGCILVTDREESIRNAIKLELKSLNFFCWNHILKDVDYWVKKHKNSLQSDSLNYRRHVWNLLNCKNEKKFEKKYKKMSESWSEPFKKYFDKCLKDDVFCSARWNLEANNLYTVDSGVTTNAAESMNAVFKRFSGRREVSLETLALCLQQFDLYYRTEILRGKCGMGNYHLKEEFLETHTKDVEDVDFPEMPFSFEKLPYVFENNDFRNQYPAEKKEEVPYTNIGIAKSLALTGKVTHLPNLGCFHVQGFQQKCLVQLFSADKPPKYPNISLKDATCTCKLKKNCHHIYACIMSLGIDVNKIKNIKLTTLMKKTRGCRSGRKKDPQDITIVEAADDSEIMKHKGKVVSINTLLIPTKSSDDSAVKHSFRSLSESEINDSDDSDEGFTKEIEEVTLQGSDDNDNQCGDVSRNKKGKVVTSTPITAGRKRSRELITSSSSESEEQEFDDGQIHEEDAFQRGPKETELRKHVDEEQNKEKDVGNNGKKPKKSNDFNKIKNTRKKKKKTDRGDVLVEKALEAENEKENENGKGATNGKEKGKEKEKEKKRKKKKEKEKENDKEKETEKKEKKEKEKENKIGKEREKGKGKTNKKGNENDNKKNHFQKLNIELPIVRKMYACNSDEISDSHLRKRYDKGQSNRIFGREIYAGHMNYIVPITEITESRQLYLNDAVLDVYLAIVIHEEASFFKENHLSIFAAESAVLNCVNATDPENDPYFQIFQHFLRFDVPIKEIVLLPFITGSHIRMCVLLTTKKIVIYLNTYWEIYKNIPIKEIRLFMICYKAFCLFRKIPFDITEWKFYAPRDVPQQNNGFDCGPMQCLLAEVIIKRNADVLNENLGDLLTYRGKMKKIIFEEWKNYTLPLDEKKYDEKDLFRFLSQPNLRDIRFLEEPPDGSGTIPFLSEVVENHWSANDSICKKCCNGYFEKDPIALCYGCKKWYHADCANAKITEYFVCGQCDQEKCMSLLRVPRRCSICMDGDSNYDLLTCKDCGEISHLWCDRHDAKFEIGDPSTYQCFSCSLSGFEEDFDIK